MFACSKKLVSLSETRSRGVPKAKWLLTISFSKICDCVAHYLFSTLRDRVPGRINSFLGALKMIITIIRHPNWIFVLIRINKGKKPATKMCRQHLIWDGKRSPWVHECYGHQSEFSWPNFAVNSSSLPIPIRQFQSSPHYRVLPTYVYQTRPRRVVFTKNSCTKQCDATKMFISFSLQSKTESPKRRLPYIYTCWPILKTKPLNNRRCCRSPQDFAAQALWTYSRLTVPSMTSPMFSWPSMPTTFTSRSPWET